MKNVSAFVSVAVVLPNGPALAIAVPLDHGACGPAPNPSISSTLGPLRDSEDTWVGGGYVEEGEGFEMLEAARVAGWKGCELLAVAAPETMDA